jgi:hypothetical protein
MPSALQDMCKRSKLVTFAQFDNQVDWRPWAIGEGYSPDRPLASDSRAILPVEVRRPALLFVLRERVAYIFTET